MAKTHLPNAAGGDHWTSFDRFYEFGKPVGNTFYVQSTNGSDSSGYGWSPDFPVASLDYAIGLCTANNDDKIVILPGHAETKAAASSFFAADVNGIEIIGLGSGVDRPTFTFSHTGAVATVSASNVKLRNLLFVAGVDSVAAPFTLSGTDIAFEDCEFRDTTDIEAVRWIITTAAADRLRFERCFHNGYTGGNAAVNFARLVGCDVAIFRGCRFLGEYSTAVIEFHTTACSKIDIDRCLFLETGTTTGAKNVVDTVGGSTWAARDCYDFGAGQTFGGSSGASSNASNAILGRRVQRATADVITNGSVNLFTITGGRVLVKALYGEVTTVIGAGATNFKFQSDPSTGTTTDLSANVDIDADEAGTLYSITGTPADATLVSSSGGVRNMSCNGIIVAAGAITCVTSADRTGSIKFDLWYIPLDDGATVAAA